MPNLLLRYPAALTVHPSPRRALSRQHCLAHVFYERHLGRYVLGIRLQGFQPLDLGTLVKERLLPPMKATSINASPYYSSLSLSGEYKKKKNARKMQFEHERSKYAQNFF